MAQGKVRFGLLGPVEVRVGDSLVPPGTPKQRAVLAVLVIHRNRTVEISELLNAAWQDGSPAGARATLHTYVHNVRRLIDGSTKIDTRVALTTAPPGYRLSLPDNDCDLGRFALEHSHGVEALAAARFERASRHFSAALAEWRGPVLDDLRAFTFFDGFAIAMAEDRLATQIARAEAEIACGRAFSVLGELEALTAEHPYREPLWVQLITAQYVTQHQSDALGAYQRLRNALADDLGVSPGRDLQALQQQILRQEPLDVHKSAQMHADQTVLTLRGHLATTATDSACGPVLRGTDGQAHRLRAGSTRIGRSTDNDVVVADAKASRFHAAIIDTGSNFVIADLQSANGVYVLGRRIHRSAVLADGHEIGIGNHHFTFEACAPEPAED